MRIEKYHPVVDALVSRIAHRVAEVQANSAFPQFNEWFNQYPIAVYARYTSRLTNEGERMRALDIGNISVAPEKHGIGYFSAFLTRMEDLADSLQVLLYVECVHSEHVAACLGKRAYTRVAAWPEGASVDSFYRKPR